MTGKKGSGQNYFKTSDFLARFHDCVKNLIDTSGVSLVNIGLKKVKFSFCRAYLHTIVAEAVKQTMKGSLDSTDKDREVLSFATRSYLCIVGELYNSQLCRRGSGE